MRYSKKRQIPTIVGSVISCCWIRIVRSGLFDYCIGIIYKWYFWVKSSLLIDMTSNHGDRYNEWNRYWWISIMDLIIIDRWRLNKLHMVMWKKKWMWNQQWFRFQYHFIFILFHIINPTILTSLSDSLSIACLSIILLFISK